MSTTSTTSKAAGKAGQKTQPPLRYVPKPKGSWRKIVGSMKDCDLSPEAFRLGAEWRERMNREGR